MKTDDQASPAGRLVRPGTGVRITDISAACYRIPLAAPLTDATHGRHDHYDLVTVEVAAAGGHTGLGYTYTVHAGGGAILALIERDLAPLLLGADAGDIEALWRRMWQWTHYVGRGGIAAFAISAVDIALWDLRAKARQEPLWRTLGGREAKPVPAYVGGIDLLLPLDELLEQTRGALGGGFRAVKMKVGRDVLGEDLERVAAMRDLVGAETALMVDANMRWSVDEAVAAARELARFGVYWLEEPIEPDDYDGHRRVAEGGGLPLAAGENLRTVSEFAHLIGAGGVAFPEPDVSNIGGISAWMKVAELAAAHRLPVTSHGVHELHVHLLAAVPNASFLEVHGFATERFVREPPRLECGAALPPDRPGHGVELDRAALRPFLHA